MNLKINFNKVVTKLNLQPEAVLNHIPLLVLIFSLIALNIGNGYIATSKIRKIQAVEKEAKILRWRFIDVQSSTLAEAKESQIAKRVENLNLKVSTTVPKTIVIP